MDPNSRTAATVDLSIRLGRAAVALAPEEAEDDQPLPSLYE